MITLAVVAALIGAALVVTGGGGDTKKAPNDTPVPTGAAAPAPVAVAPALTPQQAVQAAVVADYKTAEAVLLEVVNANPVNAADPRLPEHMTGAELGAVRNNLTVLALEGRHGTGTWSLAPVLVSLNGSTATLSECLSDHSSVVDNKTGQIVSSANSVTAQSTVTMVFVAGTWKISVDDRTGAGCVPAA